MAIPSKRPGKTAWDRLNATRDADIQKALKSDHDAAPIATPDWFRRAKILQPQAKLPVSIRLDENVVQWFRAQGRGYQTRINAVLRAYVESQSSR